MKRSRLTATSTRARSRGAPGTSTASAASRRSAPSPARPVATSPVAIPATVVSRISGNALFVPVESAQIGTSPHARATTRCVPSPPSTTMARDARGEHALDRDRAVARRPVEREVELLQVRERPRAVERGHRVAGMEMAVQRGREAVGRGQHEHAPDPRRAEPGEQAEDHAGLVGVAEHGRARDEAADVPPGRRVGDDPHGDVLGHAPITLRSGTLRAGCAGAPARLRSVPGHAHAGPLRRARRRHGRARLRAQAAPGVGRRARGPAGAGAPAHRHRAVVAAHGVRRPRPGAPATPRGARRRRARAGAREQRARRRPAGAPEQPRRDRPGRRARARDLRRRRAGSSGSRAIPA